MFSAPTVCAYGMDTFEAKMFKTYPDNSNNPLLAELVPSMAGEEIVNVETSSGGSTVFTPVPLAKQVFPYILMNLCTT